MNRALAYLALAVASIPAAASAQQKLEPPPPTVIALRPAAAPVPALKYHFVPERRELVPGNAVIFYHRAIEMILEIRQRLQAQDRTQGPSRPVSSEEALSRWISGPLREIPRDEVRQQLDVYARVLHEVELGARRQACDWEFDLRQEVIQLPIPEIQVMRTLGRLVALRVRLAVLDGKTDEAVHWLQTGFAMSRHVSQGPTLIQALVAANMTGLLNHSLQDLIQAPGTPSLYWALAACPRPFIDMTPSLEGERFLLERELPSLRELDSGPWSVAQARRFADDLLRKLLPLAELTLIDLVGGDVNSEHPGIRDMLPRLGLTAVVAKVYPEAKRALIAQGRPVAEVEAMPTIQVAALYSLQTYYQLRDDVYKWAGLPYWRSYKGIDEALRQSSACAQGSNPLLALFTQLVPVLNIAGLASVRVDRQLDALQCIEAIRIYAAAHDGALPPSLEAIAEAPAPIDPATGKPFEYQVGDGTATLSAPVPPAAPEHPAYMIRYELKLTR